MPIPQATPRLKRSVITSKSIMAQGRVDSRHARKRCRLRPIWPRTLLAILPGVLSGFSCMEGFASIIAGSNLHATAIGSPQQLPRDQPEKARVVLEIASPQPTRIHQQAKQPFQTAPLHPPRSLFDPARVKVKCRADRQHHRLHAVAMPGYPLFLFGTARARRTECALPKH
jgi:hypothetical protein